jgi:hypothetical protein
MPGISTSKTSIPFSRGGSQSWDTATNYISYLSVLTTSAFEQTVIATIAGTDYDDASFEYSTDNITFTEHGTSANGTYNATGLTANTLYFWRARLKKGSEYGDYCSVDYGITKKDEIGDYIARVIADGGSIVDETTMRATLANYDLDELIFFWDKTAGIKLNDADVAKIYDLKGNDFAQTNEALQPLWIAGAGFNITGNTQQLIGTSSVNLGKRHTIEYDIDDPTSAGPVVLHDNSDDWIGLASFSVDKYTKVYLKHSGGTTLSLDVTGHTARTNVNSIKYVRSGTAVVYTANETANNLTLSYDSDFTFSRIGGYAGSATYANIGTIGKIIVYNDIQYHEVDVLTGGGGDYTTLTAALAGVSPTYFDRYIINISETLNEYHVTPKEYTEIRGDDKATAKIIGHPDVDVESEANMTNYSTIEMVASLRKVVFRNLTISAQNLKYAVHLDSVDKNNVNKYRIENSFFDCNIIHYSNSELFTKYGTYGYSMADGIGSGFCDNQLIEIKDCYLESQAIENDCAGFRIHQAGTVPATESKLIISDSTCKSGEANEESLGIGISKTTVDLFAFNNVTLQTGTISKTINVPVTDVTVVSSGVLNGTIQVS